MQKNYASTYRRDDLSMESQAQLETPGDICLQLGGSSQRSRNSNFSILGRIGLSKPQDFYMLVNEQNGDILALRELLEGSFNR